MNINKRIFDELKKQCKTDDVIFEFLKELIVDKVKEPRQINRKKNWLKKIEKTSIEWKDINEN